MPGFVWLAKQQAQEALQHGRLEEALRRLNQPQVQDRRGAAALLGRLARASVERGERALRKDDPEAAWRDLLQSEHLHTPDRNAERLRDALTRLGVAEVRALLQADEHRRAVALAFFIPVVLNLAESVSSQSVSLALSAAPPPRG